MRIWQCVSVHVILVFFFFFFKQKTAYEMQRGLVGSEMCIRDSFTTVDVIQNSKKRNLSFLEKLGVSLAVGAFGAIVINPMDVIMVRAWADVKRPPDQRRNYKNFLDGLVRITREEGVKTLWRASMPNVARAVGLNVGMMTTYQEAKERIGGLLGECFATNALSSLLAGLCATMLALPFDNAKVKIVNMKPDAEGKMPYKGMMDCLGKCIRNEGFLRLWTGLLPVAANLGPHSIIILLVSEFIRKHMVRMQLLPQQFSLRIIQAISISPYLKKKKKKKKTKKQNGLK
eukprot:TRINITY_DN11589_c0_g1_i2.p1 TRINITY_DN11589_c0_g1~~TRINITY_DN11589_c0_g1_i2.p1  ORF type:complete len:317 (-),score=45.56 TRINITY_DN11589_c0_g1_i2:83-943(-)